MRTAFNLVSTVALLAPFTVQACDFCLLQQGMSPLESMHGSGVRLSQRYTLLEDVYAGSDHADNPGVQEEFWTTDLAAFFTPREGWLLFANLPLRVTRVHGHMHLPRRGSGREEDGDGDGEHHEHPETVEIDGREYEIHADRGGDEGIGDMSFLARYTAFQQHSLTRTTLVALSAGLKAPTGGTSGRTDDGETLDAHTQLGTGSWDFLAGIAVTHAFGRWTLSGNLLASFNGAGKAGDTEHEFGDALNYDASARYRFLPASLGADTVTVFGSLGVAGELRGHEHEGGVRVEDSGGHTVYLVPAVQMNVGARWVFEFSYREAVHHDMNAAQLGENFKVFGSVNYLF
jgi:hypothetical protein